MDDPWNVMVAVIITAVVGAGLGILVAQRRSVHDADGADNSPAPDAAPFAGQPIASPAGTTVASRVVYADSEVRETSRRAGLPPDVTSKVVEAHYDYLERNVPEGGTVVHEALVHTVAAQTGVGREQVARILDANLEWLREQGLAQDAGPV